MPPTAAGRLRRADPGLTFRYGRCTLLLRRIRAAIAVALGGRLAEHQAIGLGKDALLRLVRALPDPAAGPVRVLGVDDFALRRGHNCGTVPIAGRAAGREDGRGGAGQARGPAGAAHTGAPRRRPRPRRQGRRVGRIAAEPRLAPKTVRRFVRAATAEELIGANPTGRASSLDGHAAYLAARYKAEVTTVEVVRSWTAGGGPVWLTTAQSNYDANGRAIASRDVRSNRTSSQAITQRRQTTYGTRAAPQRPGPTPKASPAAWPTRPAWSTSAPREYGPGIGRFISVDPLQDLEGYSHSGGVTGGAEDPGTTR